MIYFFKILKTQKEALKNYIKGLVEMKISVIDSRFLTIFSSTVDDSQSPNMEQNKTNVTV